MRSPWYSTSPLILPQRVLVSRSILLASLVGIGTGKESADGGGEENGEVGRDNARLTSLLLDDVFFSFDIVADVEVWGSEALD